MQTYTEFKSLLLHVDYAGRLYGQVLTAEG